MSLLTTSDTDHIVLSADEKKRLAYRARRDLFRVLAAQAVAALLVALVFGLVSGLNAAVSALLGAACYLAPNAVFVLRLVLATFRPEGAGAATFLIGNALKVLVAIGLLWLLADVEAGRLDWIAAVVGLIAALKGYWFGLLFSGGRLSK
ncbi:MAG: ATP synthase subunit I [Burkholderiaceae bacterium]|nr:ATP synthase subunit I [Burkholderiaceae bacterium]MCD8515753.1 ATP synthase subunit I [Burkholderiaceae bacterium]MCD8537253.1 ATP synthase subunit I [Burkholderiaceae bacterium]MCD8564917.1 ATP synthase subunit I [Burkholderiaceae bacterium]